MEISDLSLEEQIQLKETPDYVLKYFAPMACGWKERAELIRRLNDEQTENECT